MGSVRHSILAVLVLALVSGSALAEIRSKEIKYKIGDQEYTGYLAWDSARSGKRPGVLVIHEWWGHNDYARTRARMLAELGYTGFAVDMYGTGVLAEHPEDAKAFAMAVMGDKSVAEQRFNVALDLLKGAETVDPERVAAIGYCMGGGIVLHMARRGADLDAVVSYHGSLATDQPAEPGSIRAPIRVFNGGADPFVSAADVSAFQAEMDAAAAVYSVKTYDGVAHSFTNPAATALGEKFDLPLRYDQAADHDSWVQTQTFLKSVWGD